MRCSGADAGVRCRSLICSDVRGRGGIHHTQLPSVASDTRQVQDKQRVGCSDTSGKYGKLRTHQSSVAEVLATHAACPSSMSTLSACWHLPEHVHCQAARTTGKRAGLFNCLAAHLLAVLVAAMPWYLSCLSHHLALRVVCPSSCVALLHALPAALPCLALPCSALSC